MAASDDKMKKADEEKDAADKLLADANAKMLEAENELKNARAEKVQADKLLTDANARMAEAEAEAEARIHKAEEEETAPKHER